MKTQELKNRIKINKIGYGTYRVVIEYRGKIYSCTSHNSLAYDRITGYADEIPDRAEKGFYTYKGALLALYNECKQANDL